MNIKINKQQHEEIVNKFVKDKISIKNLANTYHVSESCIARIIKKNNVILTGEKPRKYTFNQSFFEKINTEEKAYFLGFLYADGYNRHNGAAIVIQIQEGDRHILDEFIKKIQFTGNLLFLEKRNEKHQNMVRLELNSRKMSDDLNSLGCVQRKSLILQFPNNKQVPNNLIRHFIRGYFDGDGSISINRGGNNQYRRLAISITSSKFFCDSLNNIIVNKFKVKPKYDNYVNPSTKTLVIGGTRQAIHILNWLYKDSNIKLNRKYNKFIDFLSLCNDNRKTLNNTGGSKLKINSIINEFIK